MTYRCATCGAEHDGFPELGYQWPEYFALMPPELRDALASCDGETCVIGDPDGGEPDRFIRCVLPIPVRDDEDYFGVGLWMSVSERSLNAYLAYGRGESDEMARVVGYLSNQLPGMPSCLRLVAAAQAHDPNQRPILELQPVEHPLVHLWQNGVTRADLASALDGIIHGEEPDWARVFERLIAS